MKNKFAPASINAVAIAVCPFEPVHIKAVLPSSSCASISASSVINNVAIAVNPFLLAKIKAVLFLSSFAFTSPPSSIKLFNSTISLSLTAVIIAISVDGKIINVSLGFSALAGGAGASLPPQEVRIKTINIDKIAFFMF